MATTTKKTTDPNDWSQQPEDVKNATGFTTIWYDELMRYFHAGVKGYLDPYVDGVVTEVKSSYAVVKLSNGSSVKARKGVGSGTLRVSAYVLLFRNLVQSGYINGIPKYIATNYEIIGVRYITKDGKAFKTYRV